MLSFLQTLLVLLPGDFQPLTCADRESVRLIDRSLGLADFLGTRAGLQFVQTCPSLLQLRSSGRFGCHRCVHVGRGYRSSTEQLRCPTRILFGAREGRLGLLNLGARLLNLLLPGPLSDQPERFLSPAMCSH